MFLEKDLPIIGNAKYSERLLRIAGRRMLELYSTNFPFPRQILDASGEPYRRGETITFRRRIPFPKES